MKKPTQQQIADILNEAMSENGIMPFYKGDASLVATLCEIIGEMHNQAVARGANPQELLDAVVETLGSAGQIGLEVRS